MKKILVSFLIVVVLSGCQSRAKEVEQKASELASRSKPVDSAMLLVSEGRKQLAEGNIKEAVNSFRLATESDPKNSASYLSLAEIFMRLGKNAEAQAILEQAVQSATEDGSVFYLMSAALQGQGKTMPALLAARRSVEIFQKNNDTENLKKSMELIQALAKEMSQKQSGLLPPQANLSSQETATMIPAVVESAAQETKQTNQNFGTR